MRGELSTGALKAAGTAGLAVYAAGGTGANGAELIAAAGVLTLSAHFGNLLDTRPGRSEKALTFAAAGACVVSAAASRHSSRSPRCSSRWRWAPG
jgi:hypothetical protein